MKKFLAYELKNRLWTILIFVLICTLPYIMMTATTPMFYEWTYESEYGGMETIRNIYSPGTWMIYIELLALCFVSPAMSYAFKTSKRSVDCYYALPLKKEKLYFIKTLVGLCMVLIPFTVAYWSGFLALWLRPENPYEMGWYVPHYFGLVFFGIMLYGLNAFTFTRANTVGDGVAFMLAYQFLIFLVALYGVLLTGMEAASWGIIEFTMPFMGSANFTFNMEQLMMGDGGYEWCVWMFLFPALYGVIGYTLLFALLRYEKGENAEQVSSSWFGYKTLIPIYTAVAIGLIGTLGGDTGIGAILFCLFAAASLIANIVYRRKFRFSGKHWLAYGIGLSAGLILAVLLASVY